MRIRRDDSVRTDAADAPGGPEPRGRRVGRPPLISRAQLLDAALEVGFVHLTVGAVTARCGVKYSTFYRHFPSVEALTAAAVDRVLADVVVTTHGLTWRSYLEEMAVALAGLLAVRPGLARAVLSLRDRPEPLSVLVRDATEVLLEAGLSDDDAALGSATAIELVLIPPADGERSVDEAVAAVRLVCDGLATWLPDA